MECGFVALVFLHVDEIGMKHCEVTELAMHFHFGQTIQRHDAYGLASNTAIACGLIFAFDNQMQQTPMLPSDMKCLYNLKRNAGSRMRDNESNWRVFQAQLCTGHTRNAQQCTVYTLHTKP